MTLPNSPYLSGGKDRATARGQIDTLSDKARAFRQAASVAKVRAACEADGVSKSRTEEMISSLESAFALNGFIRSIYPGVM